MEGLRYQVAKQRRRLGKNEEDSLPEGQELFREFLENADKEKLLLAKEGEKKK